MYHATNDSLNLGHYMNTLDNGTEKSDGLTGLRSFLDQNKLPEWDVQVEDIDHGQDQSDKEFLDDHVSKLPFLVHFTPQCSNYFNGLSYDSYAGASISFRYLARCGPPAVLGSGIRCHTVIFWKKEDADFWRTAPNTKQPRGNTNKRVCDFMKLKLESSTSDECVDQ